MCHTVVFKKLRRSPVVWAVQPTEEEAEAGSGCRAEMEETFIVMEVDEVVVAREDTSGKAEETPWPQSLRHWLVGDRTTRPLL